jgi:hypothetical protein
VIRLVRVAGSDLSALTLASADSREALEARRVFKFSQENF